MSFILRKETCLVYTKTTNSLCYVDSERLRDNVHVNPADETSSLMTDKDNNNIELSSPSCPGPRSGVGFGSQRDGPPFLAICRAPSLVR